MESAFTTSPSRACARASESSDFPTAVGPTTATTGRSMASVWQCGVCPRPRKVLGGPPRSLGVAMTYADDLETHSDEDELDDELDDDEFDLDDSYDDDEYEFDDEDEDDDLDDDELDDEDFEGEDDEEPQD